MRNQYNKRRNNATTPQTPQDYESLYTKFIESIIQNQMLWGIATDHWTICTNGSGQKAMPVWALQSDAKLCCFGAWQSSETQSINLTIFMQKVIPYLLEHKMLIAINRTPNGEALFIHPERINAELIPVQ